VRIHGLKNLKKKQKNKTLDKKILKMNEMERNKFSWIFLNLFASLFLFFLNFFFYFFTNCIFAIFLQLNGNLEGTFFFFFF
jgi:quinol-cytochrome oxidoreductase complex cytochrome b subunit